MCNREGVLEVIDDYVSILKDSNRRYCISLEKRKICEANCEECKDEYYESMRVRLEKKCGVSDGS